MPVADKAQIGTVDEVTYGTPVTVTRFHDFLSEDLSSTFSRLTSDSLRAGSTLVSSDRAKAFADGAAGTIRMEVPSKGFAWWLKHMLGTVATTGPVDSKYTHTATFASLWNQSFTTQVNRPENPSETDRVWTYHGCKVASWELSCADGFLTTSITLDAEEDDITTAKATATYPTGTEVFSYLEGTVEVADVAFVVNSFSLRCDNGLAQRQRKMSTVKKRQPGQGRRTLTWTIDAEFDSMAQVTRARSATIAGALAKLEFNFTGQTVIGVSSNPTFNVTVDSARFDEAAVNVSGTDPLQQRLSGIAMAATNPPLTIAYGSADVTP